MRPPTEEEKAEIRKLNEILTDMLSGIGASLGRPDWTYRDLPRMSLPWMTEFKRIVGSENLHWITFANYGTSCRGQVLISPVGMDRLREYNREGKNNVQDD